MTAGTDDIYVGNYQFAVQYTLGGAYLYESVNLVIMPAMTNDPRSPNHVTTGCLENYYPFYIGGSSYMYLEHGTVDSYGNFLLSGWSS